MCDVCVRVRIAVENTTLSREALRHCGVARFLVSSVALYTYIISVVGLVLELANYLVYDVYTE